MFSKKSYYPDPGNRRFPRTPPPFNPGNRGNYIIIYYNYNKLSITSTKIINGVFLQWKREGASEGTVGSLDWFPGFSDITLDILFLLYHWVELPEKILALAHYSDLPVFFGLLPHHLLEHG